MTAWFITAPFRLFLWLEKQKTNYNKEMFLECNLEFVC